MIKAIIGGPGLSVSNGSFPSSYIDMSRPSAGMTRYTGNNLEVYDGSMWVIISSGAAHVSLDNVTLEALQWVRAKMEQEKRMTELAKSHPTIADALLARDRADEAVKIAVALCDTK